MTAGAAALLVAALAFCFGFASQRSTVCGVLAAQQIVQTGRLSRLLAFLAASLLALAVVVPLSWLTEQLVLADTVSGTAVALIGGALYGAGTVINGACVFGTASRVLAGNMSFLSALPGMALGAGLGISLGLPHLRTMRVDSPLHEPNPAALAIVLLAVVLVAAILAGVVRRHRRSGASLHRVVRAARWPTWLAMVVMGATGGLLFATRSEWSYLSLMRLVGQITFGQPVEIGPASVIGPVALVVGGAASVLAGGVFVLRAFSVVQLARSLAGGAVMGFAATLVPGGNDMLLLSALPSLASHGVIAYSAMLGMQVLLLLAIKHRK